MTLHPGNALTLAVGKQTDIGTPATDAQLKLRYTGGFGPDPVRNTLITAETDSFRQAGDPVVVGLRAEGDSEIYVRPSEHHILAHALLGHTDTSMGVHTAYSTDDGSAPYYTLTRYEHGVPIGTQMSDMQVGQIQWSGGAEQALAMALSWLGLTALLGVDDISADPAADAPLVYPQVTIAKGSRDPGTTQSFQLVANQNRSLFIGDSGLSAADVVAGLYAVTGQLVMAVISDDDWREFITGDVAGTTPGTTISSEALTITVDDGGGNTIVFELADIITTAYAPQPNTDGSPLVAQLDFVAKRGATLADVLTVVTTNGLSAP